MTANVTLVQRYRPIVLAALAGVTVFAASVVLALGALNARGKPEQIFSARPAVVRTLTGTVIATTFVFLRESDCNATISSWLWTWLDDPVEGRVPWFVAVSATPITLADPSPDIQKLTIARPLPVGLFPGQWFLRTKYLDKCALLAPLLGASVHEAPDHPLSLSRDQLLPDPQH